MRSLRPAALAAILAADRVTKIWALRDLRPRGTIELLPFFDLTYVENTGAAFGLGRGANANAVFVALSAGLIWALARMMARWPRRDPWLQAGGTLVLGGALGNLYDRLSYGFVVDFLHLHHWPVFNVADSCITVGAVMLAWGLREK